MLFVIHMTDRPEASELRASVAEAHREFVGAIGSMIVMDFPDRAAAIEMISQEPYNQAGLFESVVIRAFHPVVTPQ